MSDTDSPLGIVIGPAEGLGLVGKCLTPLEPAVHDMVTGIGKFNTQWSGHGPMLGPPRNGINPMGREGYFRLTGFGLIWLGAKARRNSLRDG